ncbi:Acyl-CoA dehydrogenase, N-terminal domain [Brevibacterium sp. Mu109]|nr:Acyl-CoA dehydrogenase, N-terminal domain [Brevibacterium sp. Mu109]
MDIEPQVDLAEFRAEVAEFLDTAPTPEILEAGRKTTSVFAPFEQVMAWHRILHSRGWSAPDWPVEHGGPGWSVEQQYVFADEYQKRGLPPLLPNGLKMVGPLLMEIGTPEQQEKHLPGILSGDDYWTQGYSEPGAGSDLASLSCSAVADGDDYILNGSKIWTTYAHHANRMFMLVRTSREGRKQAGITFLLLDRMDYPGIEVRPIVGLDGAPEQCEVFFTDARVPQSGSPTPACPSPVAWVQRTTAGPWPSSCSRTSGAAARRAPRCVAGSTCSAWQLRRRRLLSADPSPTMRSSSATSESWRRTSPPASTSRSSRSADTRSPRTLRTPR